jgi:hypothetical protein
VFDFRPIFPSPRPGHLVIALDDNDCMQLPERKMKPNESAATASASIENEMDMADGNTAHFVHVRPILALIHEDYFEQHIDLLIQKHRPQDVKSRSVTIDPSTL